MTEGVGAPVPVVSVIVPVWNVEPWLRQCLDSVVEQSIGLENLELIAVDDGSTDASGAILDEYAARHPNVIVRHEPNSGGPGRPRNLALEMARGRYVFFLDADDYLGPEALERAVAMADGVGSDIVVPRIVAVEGRRVRRDTGIFERPVPHASLDQVYHSLNVLKLFRRSFLQGSGLRFREDVAGGEDGDLMSRLYPLAKRLSVVGDYDAYFTRYRPGSQTQRRDSPAAMAAYLRRIETDRMVVLASARRPGRGRDRLMRRHFKKIAGRFGGTWRSFEPDERRTLFELGAEIVRRWHTERLERLLATRARLRIHCLQHGLLTALEDVVATSTSAAFSDPIVEGRRIYARYPHFRDGLGIPDRCFEISDDVRPKVRLTRADLTDARLRLAGEAYLTLVGGTTTIELRRWPRGPRWRFDAPPLPTPLLRDGSATYPNAGFDLEIELATSADGRPLSRGTWQVGALVGRGRVQRWTAIRVAPAGDKRRKRPGRPGIELGGGLYLAPGRELRLRVGRRHPLVTTLEGPAAVAARLARLTRTGVARARRELGI
jgi:CDP-glycerol glycerophosphotransferase